MAFTQTELDNLEEAIATGARTYEYNGKRVSFDTLDQLMARRRLIQQELGLASVPQAVVSESSKGLG